MRIEKKIFTKLKLNNNEKNDKCFRETIIYSYSYMALACSEIDYTFWRLKKKKASQGNRRRRRKKEEEAKMKDAN